MTYERFLEELAEFKGHFQITGPGIIRLTDYSEKRNPGMVALGICLCPLLVILNKNEVRFRTENAFTSAPEDAWKKNVIVAADNWSWKDRKIRQQLLDTLGLKERR